MLDDIRTADDIYKISSFTMKGDTKQLVNHVLKQKIAAPKQKGNDKNQLINAQNNKGM